MEMRDLEVLRTLARLHFVGSAQLNGTFFPSENVGYRRLRSLASRDFIKRHSKGAPPRSSYCAWRLTPNGMGVVRDEFGEDVPEGLDERLATQSLVDLDHREAISSIYLALIGGGDTDPADEQSWQALQTRMATIRRRAGRIRWQADGALVLRFRELGQEHRLVPDATVESVDQPTRLFLELDRSSKPLGRIEENLRRYAAFVKGRYRAQYPDGHSPWVAYFVRSPHRGHNIAKLAQSILGSGCRWKVTTHGEAAGWLAEVLLGEQRAASDPRADVPATAHDDRPCDASMDAPVLRAAAHELLRSTSDLLKRHTTSFETMSLSEPDLVSRWKRDLRALYELVREGTHGQR